MSKKLLVEWLTKTPQIYNSFHLNDFSAFRGSHYYEYEVLKALSKTLPVSVNKNYIKGEEGFLSYHLKNHSRYLNGDVCIIDQNLLQFGKFNRQKSNIGIIHHINHEFYSRSFFNKFIYKNLIRNLKKVHQLVVVSEYWKKFFIDLGVENIKVIRCSYRISDYAISDNTIQSFKDRYNLNQDKPIIYLGPNHYGKGVKEVLSKLDLENYTLVATGKNNVEHPQVKTFFFSDSEYRVFLASCDVTLCMSVIMEGWNRVAHESLLAKTPVIGTDKGGMGELLRNSGQIILNDFNGINEAIVRCLQHNFKYIESGYSFVSQFDEHYFETSWLEAVWSAYQDNV